MKEQIVIDGQTYIRVPLRIKTSGITDICYVYTQTPLTLQSMLDTTANTIAEEKAETTLTNLIRKKVEEFLFK